MVKFCYFFFAFFNIFSLFADVLVESTINQNTAYLHFPVSGTITITHDKNSIIDASSFKLRGKTLEVSLVKNVYLNGNTAIAIYNFSLPAQELGMYVLPSIDVTVDSKVYHSASTNYSIVDSVPVAQVKETQETTFLKLEAFVRGTAKLYPGERTTLVYRISYNRSVDLTKSELPFIHTDVFLRVGDSQIQEEQQGALTVQEISQVIEATTVGKYVLGPSFIEGYAYQMNLLGKKEYGSQLLRAEAPAVEIQVNLFSNEDQPASFNGTIGKIHAKTSLLSSNKASMGQTLSLSLDITGATNLSEVHLPALMCQPGFSGLFSMDELAIYSQMEGKTKKFFFELRLLNALAFEIPSIELSSFDSLTKSYQIVHTEAIPLELQLNEIPSTESPAYKLQLFPDAQQVEQLFLQNHTPLALNNTLVTLHTLQLPFYQRKEMLYCIPLVLLFLAGQLWWRNQRLAQYKKDFLYSRYYLKQAENKLNVPEEFLKSLEAAIVWKLVEIKIYEQPKIDLGILTSHPELEKYKTILLQIQTYQFSLNKKFDEKELLKKVHDLVQT